MTIHANTSIEALVKELLKDVLAKENFDTVTAGKGSFLTGGSIIVCESKGLQEYIQKTCADEYGIWTALPFKPLAGLLMQCAYNLSAIKKDESENVFNQSNLVWAIYRLLEGEKKTFFFANELASLFMAYQIYRPQLIKNWNNGLPYTITDADKNFIKNEKFQREIWIKLRQEYKNEQDIMQLYELFKNEDKKILPKQIFIFSPVAIAPVQLEAFRLLSESGCKVNLYINQISREYIGDAKSKKSIGHLRKKAWENNKIFNEDLLYWDIGNKLITNLGRSAQVLYEQIGWDNFEYVFDQDNDNNKTMLSVLQDNIRSDTNPENNLEKDDSITLNSCFSPLREAEVLCDYILSLFENDEAITCADIAVVCPDIEEYASAIESVFRRYEIPFVIADRDVKKHDKTARLLGMIFSLIGSRYEAPEIAALFEYSMLVQEKELEANDIELLHKWINENAVRHGLEEKNAGGYSFENGFNQLSSGFFMISESEFSEKGVYCYPDITAANSGMLGDFFCFIEALKTLDAECMHKDNGKTIKEWDSILRECLKPFFGTDVMDFNEEKENPYQEVITAWDSLKEEMRIGFGNTNPKIDFAIIKTALPCKIESGSKYHYTASGRISIANIDTLRAVPHKVVCCIGMNGKKYPKQVRYREISLMKNYILGDKDTVNEDRLIFLETILSAKEKLYISWIGQDEKTGNELEPSGVVTALLEYLNSEGTKHPLQPFSYKYYNEELNKTYDTRWNNDNFIVKPDINVWKWRINNSDNENKEENYNINQIIAVLNDVSKYFIKNVCNISLPDNAEILSNMEPFILDNALEKWKLSSDVINLYDNDEYLNEIKKQKRRGELPDGKFADNLINEIIKETKELKELSKNEKEGTYWIIPSKDKGKYRLRHWLYHLDYNANIQEKQNTKMFLKDKEPVILELKGLSQKKANEYLLNIKKLIKELDTRLIPVFPNVAWTYINEGEIDYIDAFIEYSQYAQMAFKNIDEIEGELKEEFIRCSEVLFGGYNGTS